MTRPYPVPRADPTPYCRACGKVCPKLPTQTWAEWEALTFCDDSCRAAGTTHTPPASARRLRRSELILELEHLRGTDTPENLAARLGTNTSALARRLHRANRCDLAAPFDAAERRTRRSEAA